MKVLLDTSVFLWYITANHRITTEIKNLIQSQDNTIFVSPISLWEAVVKHQAGRLNLPPQAYRYLVTQREQHNFQSLGITEETISFLPELPNIHRDPFDKLLICQALENRLSFITSDRIIPTYPVSTIKV